MRSFGKIRNSLAVMFVLLAAPAALAYAPPPEAGRVSAPEFAPGEVVFQLTLDAALDGAFRADLLTQGRTGLSALDARLAALGAVEIEPVFDLTLNTARKQAAGMDRIFLARYESGVDPLVAAGMLAGEEIAFSEPNRLARAMLAPNDTYYPAQWAHNNTGQAVSYTGGYVGTPDCDTDTDQAWDLGTGDPALILSIIDTGVDAGHPEFAGRIVAGYDFVNYDSNPADDNGHGTSCAGIALAAGNNAQGIAGVAWAIKLMPVKVLNSSGSGTFTAVANGMTWAADHGARVLSLSLGGGASSVCETALNYAYGLGCAIFCAAGNGNRSSLDYPAAYANAIAVGALSPCNERKNPGSCDGETWWGSNYGTGLDFLAPGTRIHTTDMRGSGGFGSGDYISTFNGTSSATPHAAGIGALVWSANPDLTNAQMLAVLQSTCDDLGTSGYDTQTGWGRMNAYQAVLNSGGGGGGPTPVTIFTETFESTTVPGSVWSASDANATSGLDYWGDQAASAGARVHGGSWSAYCADYSNVSGQKYDNYMNADLTLINPISVSGYTDLRLSFWIWYRTYNNSDYLSFQYWNGTAWVEQQRWSGSSSTWVNPSYALSGFTTLQFRFVFYSNRSQTREGAYVDDILLTGISSGALQGEGPLAVVWLGEEQDSAPAEPVAAASVSPAHLSISTGGSMIRCELPTAARARLEVYTVDGRQIALLHDGALGAGEHIISWNGLDTHGQQAAAGIYYARLLLNGQPAATQRIVIVR